MDHSPFSPAAFGEFSKGRIWLVLQADHDEAKFMFCQGLFESDDAIANMRITLIGIPENRINPDFFRERDEGSDWVRGDAILHRCAGCWLFKAAPINMNDGGMRNFFPQGRPYSRKGAIHTLGNDLVSNLDFAQTFLDIAGASEPEEMQGASLTSILKGDTPDDWRDAHYYHYYEFPGWHMVHRHEGVYDGRYKLMNFYEIKEWELYDLETDPQEMLNQIANSEYADVVKRLKGELERLRMEYDVPGNVKQDLSKIDMRYHSEEIRKRGLERRRQREARAQKAKQ